MYVWTHPCLVVDWSPRTPRTMRAEDELWRRLGSCVGDLGLHAINSYYYYMRQMGINCMQATFWITYRLWMLIFGHFLRENNYLQLGILNLQIINCTLKKLRF